MNYSEKIDRYFNSTRTDEQENEFEQLVLNNPVFADEVAFYVKSKALFSEQCRQHKKMQFKEIYQTEKQHIKPGIYKSLIRRIAVAASITVIVTLVAFFWWQQKPTAGSLADRYISQNWNVLSVHMSAATDSLQQALQLYNNRQLQQSVEMLEQVLQTNLHNAEALKYAGIAHHKTGDYEKAIKRFELLAADNSLRVNPGNFYRAIALIKRNAEGDLKQARILLKKVINNRMEGEKQARIWLKQLY